MPQNPVYTITGDSSFTDNSVSFQIAFQNAADQPLVQSYEWYLDGILVTNAIQQSFNAEVACGNHIISARVLYQGVWTGTQELAFTTCFNYMSILVVDLYTNSTLNVIGLIDNAEVTESHQAAYTGNNFIPAGAAVADALILASDFINQNPLNWRFEFNLHKLKLQYPTTDQFRLYIKGRGATAVALNGAYVVFNQLGTMAMANSPGTYVPTVSGGTIIVQQTHFTANVVAGANGSYNEADLTTIIEFIYTVSANTVTFNT